MKIHFKVETYHTFIPLHISRICQTLRQSVSSPMTQGVWSSKCGRTPQHDLYKLSKSSAAFSFVSFDLRQFGFIAHLKRPSMCPNVWVVQVHLKLYLFATLITLIKFYRRVKSYESTRSSARQVTSWTPPLESMLTWRFKEIATKKAFIWHFIVKLQTSNGCTEKSGKK